MNDKPKLKMELTNEFGQFFSVEYPLEDTQMEEVATAIAYCLRGFGYSDKTVQEYIEVEL